MRLNGEISTLDIELKHIDYKKQEAVLFSFLTKSI